MLRSAVSWECPSKIRVIRPGTTWCCRQTTRPVAPKLIYHNGYYYMASAEGATSGPTTAHMSIMARSRSVEGPWANSPYNPFVHTQSQDEKWWRQGHGTLIDDAEGKWWFLYTGYENGFTVFGKQSLLLPVGWTADGWPRTLPGAAATDLLPKPAGENVGHGMPLPDDFSSTAPGIQWQYAMDANPTEIFHAGDDQLPMEAKGAIPGQAAVLPADATTLGVMPVNHAYEAEVAISIPNTAEAGLMLGGGGKLTDIQRGEPERSLFEVPSDYTVKPMPSGFESPVDKLKND